MTKHEKEELHRIHLWIYRRDYERLKTYYGDNAGMSRVARKMIHDYLNNVEAKASARYVRKDSPNVPELPPSTKPPTGGSTD